MLRVTEIFYSLQGESNTVGLPTVFVRLTGCPLRCQYCDTEYAFHGGRVISLKDIMNTVMSYHPQYVTVTGGEPLAQPNCLALLQQLLKQNYVVSLETSGALDVSTVDERVIKVVDFKTPGSGEVSKNRWENIGHLFSQDQVKFVICDKRDYDWSKKIIEQYHLLDRCQVLFSPSHGQLDNRSLADWILADRLSVRFQVQLHKYIWGNEPGR